MLRIVKKTKKCLKEVAFFVRSVIMVMSSGGKGDNNNKRRKL